MKMMAFIALLLVSMVVTAEAVNSGASDKYPVESSAGNSEPCASYGCNDSGYQDDRNDQSSNDTYVTGSGTYEGNDRDTGSDYIDGMPY